MNRIGNGPTPPGGKWDPERNDWFFDHFDRKAESFFDNMEFKPKRTFFKFGLVAIALNLIFWGAIIAMVIFGLSFII